MASIKFQVRGKRNPSKITARLIIDKRTDYRKTIPLLINPAYFNNKTGKVRQLAEYRGKDNIKNSLADFRTEAIREYNKTRKNGGYINSAWFEDFVNQYFNLVEVSDLGYLDNYCAYYIDNLKTKTNEKTGEIGVSKATLTKYNTLRNKILSFQKHTRRKYRLVDVGLDFRKEFITYLLDKENLSRNTTGRYIGFLKTVCLNAQQRGQKVSNELPQMRGFKVEVKKIYLTLDELDTIQTTDYDTDQMETAKDWLIIGCYIGQRAGDLLSLTAENLSFRNGRDFIDLVQQKTKKRVSILVPPVVSDILKKRNGDFPPPYSQNIASAKTVFNRHIKKVCRLAGISQMVDGGKMNPETSRKENGTFPKWELVTSHICRRSFASNYYGEFPTPLLLNYTGHSTEKEFLNYIGKTPIDYADQMALYWDKMTQKQKKTSVLRKAQ